MVGEAMARSGHTTLLRMVIRYFELTHGQAAQTVNGLTTIGPFTYCEQYHHCHVVPCPLEPAYQKDHDFERNTPTDAVAIVQCRNRLDAMFSLYRKTKTTPDSPPTLEGWGAFRDRWEDYYAAWERKWLSLPGIPVISYDEMYAHPACAVSLLLQSLDVDPARRLVTLAAVPPKPPSQRPPWAS